MMEPWVYAVRTGKIWTVDSLRVSGSSNRQSFKLTVQQAEGRMKRGVPLVLLENK